jgi:hypothetical protein
MPPSNQEERHRPFLPCGTVARNRARRQAARRQLPKAMTPAIAAAIFLSLMFNRFQQFVAGWNCTSSLDSHKGPSSYDPPPETGARSVSLTPASIDGSEIRIGKSERTYQPPASFRSEHLAQMVAFLIRHRGRIDNEAVKEKWRHLDHYALPLAVYLRDIEANEAWDDLELEMKDILRPDRHCAATPSTLSRSTLALIPDWSRRGEELIAAVSALAEPISSLNPAQGDDLKHSGDDATTPRHAS